MAQTIKNLPAVQKTQLQSLGWEDPLEKGMAMATTPLLLPGKSMDGGAWWAAVHGVAKSQTLLSIFTFTGILAWRIPWT